MRNVYSVLPFIFFAVSLAAQQSPTITFKVTDGKEKPVKYIKPFEGKYFEDFPIPDTLDANGVLVLPNQEKVPGVYGFIYKKLYRLYVQPGKQYTVTIDQSNKNNPITVQGPNQEAQLALLQLNMDAYGYQAQAIRYYKEDSIFENNRARIHRELDSCIQPFHQLHKQGKMDAGFFAYTENLFRNYYAAVLGALLMKPVRALEFNKDSARYDAAKIRTIQGYWQDVQAISNVFEKGSMYTDTYPAYYNFYNNWYLDYFLLKKKGLYKTPKDEDTYQTAAHHVLLEHYKQEPLREYVLASLIHTQVLENRFPSVIPDWYTSFTKQYPRSRYTPLLTPGVEKVKAFLDTRKATLAAGQTLLENFESIETVDQLAARFKAKIVFVDLWATWCGPCKEEFAHSAALKSFLSTKGIEMLYVSIDKKEVDLQWKTMIKYYNLQGLHLRASDKLNKDLHKVLGNKELLAIPRYLIIKDGKIVQANAKAPSQKDKLYQELEQYL
jgi:thiol-disulfide isomerase/thioredoxin